MLATTTPDAPLYIYGDATGDTGIGTAAEALALIAEGIMDADGLTFRAEHSPRTFRIVFKRDYRREMAGLDWRVAITGPGHWCQGSDGRGNALHSGTFRTVAEAIARGVDWIETGRDRSAWADNHNQQRSAAA